MKIRHIANFLVRVLNRERSTSSTSITEDHENACADSEQNVKKDIIVKLKDRKKSDDLYPLW
jgi:hypothetical protein